MFEVDINARHHNRLLGPRNDKKSREDFPWKQASKKICTSKLPEGFILTPLGILVLTTTNIWELYWIVSSQTAKTFKNNNDTNIVQQTRCESQRRI